MNIPVNTVNSSLLLSQSRADFFHQIHSMIEQAQAGSQVVALVRFGIDRLRKINRHHGFAVGDQVLEELKDRLTNLEVNDIAVYCFGHGEYALAINGESESQLKTTIANIFEILEAEYHIGNETVRLRFSGGVALSPTDCMDEACLVLAAEAAREQAHDEGGARIRFYINKLHEQTLHRERMS
ncbi:MAG: GGDEF domain-containing protein, partial [Gammaproteobacteria bacterium]|nr:GGDEF domain-containing protein [Gammaproteobacteria bacterium]